MAKVVFKSEPSSTHDNLTFAELNNGDIVKTHVGGWYIVCKNATYVGIVSLVTGVHCLEHNFCDYRFYRLHGDGKLILTAE